MNKTELESALNSHPNFSADRLYQLCDGKRVTNVIMWAYLCELHHWVPLEVIATNNPDWVLVASSSEIGVWHKISVVHQTCDCLFSEHHDTPCCHLSAAMAHEESAWIAYANRHGFKVQCSDGRYQISDLITQQPMGTLSFEENRSNKWVLADQRNFSHQSFQCVHDAIDHLAAIASFGWQLA